MHGHKNCPKGSSVIKKNELKENDAVIFNQSMASGRGNFRFGGFLLGLLVGLIGVELAYIFSSDKVNIKIAWKGFAIWVAIVFATLGNLRES